MKRREFPSAASIRSRDIAALGRAVSLIERGDSRIAAILDQLSPGSARRVVLTGPMGVGKSSLLREILRRLAGRGETVAVLACDPVSTRTRGAFLGDRLRFADLAETTGLFVRSRAHVESSSAVSETEWRIVGCLDAAGFDWIFVETVGAGQAEGENPGDAMRVVALAASLGDEFQMLKAGLLESADLFVVNKSDLPGSVAWSRRLEDALRHEDSSSQRVLSASARTGEGIDGIIEYLGSFSERQEPT